MKKLSKKTKLLVIVHGKSEFRICKSIQSNLKIKQYIKAEQNGAKSIQITSLMNTLNNRNFKTVKSFTQFYNYIEFKKKNLLILNSLY